MNKRHLLKITEW